MWMKNKKALISTAAIAGLYIDFIFFIVRLIKPLLIQMPVASFRRQ
jgi:hypothetical protein